MRGNSDVSQRMKKRVTLRYVLHRGLVASFSLFLTFSFFLSYYKQNVDESYCEVFPIHSGHFHHHYPFYYLFQVKAN